MIVRKAELSDMHAYVELACKFHSASPMNSVCEFDRTGYEDFYAKGIANESMLFLIAENNDVAIGICGALIYPLYFAPTHIVAQELWWYLNPSDRGNGAGQLMLSGIENWASNMGAKSLFMIALADKRVEKMERIYGRAGYLPMERTYMKEVA